MHPRTAPRIEQLMPTFRSFKSAEEPTICEGACHGFKWQQPLHIMTSWFHSSIHLFTIHLVLVFVFSTGVLIVSLNIEAIDGMQEILHVAFGESCSAHPFRSPTPAACFAGPVCHVTCPKSLRVGHISILKSYSWLDLRQSCFWLWVWHSDSAMQPSRGIVIVNSSSLLHS